MRWHIKYTDCILEGIQRGNSWKEKTLFFGEIQQHFGKRNHAGLWEIFSTHLKKDIQEGFGKFWLASFRKGMRGAGKRKDSSTPNGGSRMFLRKRSQVFGKTSATF